MYKLRIHCISGILALLSFSVFLPGQTLERLTVEDGLSQGFIIDALQTRSGFLWFATLDGLNRYDGVGFKVYRPGPEQSDAAQRLIIRQLLEDSRQFLWILFHDGLALMDQQTERFHFLPNNKVPGLQLMCEDAQGHLWGIGADKVLYRLTFPPGNTRPEECLAALQIAAFPLACLEETGLVYSITPMDTGIWIGAGNGVFEFSFGKKTCSRVPGMPRGPISGIWRDTTGMAVWLYSGSILYRWFAGQLRMFRLDDEPNVIIKRGVSNGRITCFFGQKHVYQWLGNELRKLPHEISDGILSGCVDREGILWIGTNARGVRKIALDHFYFDRMGPGMSLNRPLLYDRAGQLWLTMTPAGYSRYDWASGRLGRPFLTGKGTINLLIQARSGTYWFVLSGREFCEAERPGDYSTCFPLAPGHYSILFEDRQGRILLAAPDGAIIRFDPVTQQRTRHSFAALWNNRVQPTINVMVEDRAGRLLIGTSAGLVLATPDETDQSYRFQLFSNRMPGSNGLTDNRVLALAPDATDPDVCWVGTQHGLNRLNVRTAGCRQFTASNGLPNDVICSILPEDDRRIWLGTYFGLLEFDTRSFAWRHFTAADGLPCNEFNHNAALRLPDGRLLFGGVDGFTIFRPADTRRRHPAPPRLCLTGLSVGPRRISPGDSTGILKLSPAYTKYLTLKHDENNLFFQFALLDFFRTKGHRYAFRMRGLHDDWHNNGASNEAAYFNVSPGNYVFEVIAYNHAGVRGEPLLLEIAILKPWWHTAWAYALYVIMTLAVIGTGLMIWADRARMRNRLQLEHREAARFKELEQFKSRLFSNFTHEFRTPLAIIRGYTEQLSRETKGKVRDMVADIQQQTDEMLHLTGQILDLVKLEEKQLRLFPEPVDLNDYLNRLCKSFEILAARKQIDFSWQIPAGSVWAMVDLARLRDILTNLVVNALKFTPEGGSVIFSLACPDDARLQITVSDSGPGIAPEHREKIFERYFQVKRDDTPADGLGIGLSYVAELTRAMGGHIEVRSNPGQGSAFVVTLPAADIARAGHVPVNRPAEAPAFSEEREQPPELPVLLIVEDNVSIAKLMAGYVSGRFRVEFAVNGRAGLEKALEQVPDIVICDLRMPEMDGFAFCKTLRANMHTSHIPVIILTAFVDEADRLKALRAGANAWLTKPADPEVLRQQLDNFLQLRQQMHLHIRQESQENPSVVSSPTFETERAFMQQLMAIIAKRYDDPDFSVADIQKAFNLSKSQLHRKLISISGHPANYFIRKYRLDEAKNLLRTYAHLTVAEVAYRVGFSDPNYFSRTFSAEFGQSPSAFRQMSST